MHKYPWNKMGESFACPLLLIMCGLLSCNFVALIYWSVQQL